MYCPSCGSEYQPGVKECVDCGIPLVATLDKPRSHESDEFELEVVFADSRQELVAVAKSILMSAGIEYGVRGEGVQDFFGWGRFPVGTNVFIGPIQIVVPSEQAADAKVLLAGVSQDENPAGIPGGDAAYVAQEPVDGGFLWSRTRSAARLISAIALAYAVIMLALAAYSYLQMS